MEPKIRRQVLPLAPRFQGRLESGGLAAKVKLHRQRPVRYETVSGQPLFWEAPKYNCDASHCDCARWTDPVPVQSTDRVGDASYCSRGYGARGVMAMRVVAIAP